MYLVAIAWIYVVLMMALAEALSTQGTVLGAVITFVLYGVLPLSILMYVMGTPLRRRARRAAEQAAEHEDKQEDDRAAAAAAATASLAAPDGGGQAAGGQPQAVLAPEGKEV
jgi:uncharacterized membrane protein